MDENELVYMYQQDKNRVISEYIKYNKPLIYYLIMRINKDEQYISYYDDFFQIALIKLANAFENYSYTFGVKFTNFYTVLLRNGLIDYIRTLNKTSKYMDYFYTKCSYLEIEDFACDYNVNNLAVTLEEKVLFLTSFELDYKEFNENEKVALSLWIQGYTYSEIAEAMDTNIKTVANIVKDVRMKLANKEKEYINQVN